MKKKRKPGRPSRRDEPARLTVHLPGSLKQRLRLYALKEDRDMGDLVAEALEGYLPRTVRVVVQSLESGPQTVMATVGRAVAGRGKA